MPVVPRLPRGFIRWFRLGGPWGRRVKASSEGGRVGRKQAGTHRYFNLPHPRCCAEEVGWTTPILQVRQPIQKRLVMGDFLGGPVAKTPCFPYRGPGV